MVKIKLEIDTGKPKDVEDSINMLETFNNNVDSEDEDYSLDSEDEDEDDYSNLDTEEDNILIADRKPKPIPGDVDYKNKIKVKSNKVIDSFEDEDEEINDVSVQIPKQEEGILIEEEDEY